jgi:hypothetical protein
MLMNKRAPPLVAEMSASSALTKRISAGDRNAFCRREETNGPPLSTRQVKSSMRQQTSHEQPTVTYMKVLIRIDQRHHTPETILGLGQRDHELVLVIPPVAPEEPLCRVSGRRCKDKATSQELVVCTEAGWHLCKSRAAPAWSRRRRGCQGKRSAHKHFESRQRSLTLKSVMRDLPESILRAAELARPGGVWTVRGRDTFKHVGGRLRVHRDLVTDHVIIGEDGIHKRPECAFKLGAFDGLLEEVRSDGSKVRAGSLEGLSWLEEEQTP